MQDSNETVGGFEKDTICDYPFTYYFAPLYSHFQKEFKRIGERKFWLTIRFAWVFTSICKEERKRGKFE